MITAAQVKALMPASSSYETDVITPTIAQVVSLFEARTNRLWSLRTGYVQIQRVADFRRDGTIFFDLYPIQSLSLVGWNSPSTAADAEDIDSLSYYADLDVGHASRIDGAPWPEFVRATITGGYTANTAPAAVQAALVDQVIYHLTRGGQNSAATSASTVNGSKSFKDKQFSDLFSESIQFYARRAGH